MNPTRAEEIEHRNDAVELRLAKRRGAVAEGVASGDVGRGVDGWFKAFKDGEDGSGRGAQDVH